MRIMMICALAAAPAWAGLGALAGAGALAQGVAQGASVTETAPSQRSLRVTGTGEITRAPDMAVLRLGVTKEATTAEDAMAATRAAAQKVMSRLEALEIEPRDVQTSRLSLDPVWSDQRDGNGGLRQRKITGYAASTQLVLRLRDLDRVGAAVMQLVGDGANDFGGLQFALQEPAEAEAEARRAAVADALAKARLYAEAAGVTLGPLQSLSEMGGNGPRPMPMMEMARADSAGTMPVAPGEITLQASVEMVFAIGD